MSGGESKRWNPVPLVLVMFSNLTQRCIVVHNGENSTFDCLLVDRS